MLKEKLQSGFRLGVVWSMQDSVEGVHSKNSNNLVSMLNWETDHRVVELSIGLHSEGSDQRRNAVKRNGGFPGEERVRGTVLDVIKSMTTVSFDSTQYCQFSSNNALQQNNLLGPVIYFAILNIHEITNFYKLSLVCLAGADNDCFLVVDHTE